MLIFLLSKIIRRFSLLTKLIRYLFLLEVALDHLFQAWKFHIKIFIFACVNLFKVIKDVQNAILCLFKIRAERVVSILAFRIISIRTKWRNLTITQSLSSLILILQHKMDYILTLSNHICRSTSRPQYNPLFLASSEPMQLHRCKWRMMSMPMYSNKWRTSKPRT